MGTNWEDQIFGSRKPRRSPADSGNNRRDKSCCFGAAAVKAAKQRKFRLARRYAVRCVHAVATRRFA